eukprot:6192799-Pleurochrysis_carterae.AAC.1
MIHVTVLQGRFKCSAPGNSGAASGAVSPLPQISATNSLQLTRLGAGGWLTDSLVCVSPPCPICAKHVNTYHASAPAALMALYSSIFKEWCLVCLLAQGYVLKQVQTLSPRSHASPFSVTLDIIQPFVEDLLNVSADAHPPFRPFRRPFECARLACRTFGGLPRRGSVQRRQQSARCDETHIACLISVCIVL